MRFFLASAFFAFTVGAGPAFAADNLISADKTLFVQFAIFLAALYLLNVLFFRPLMDLADRRDEATSGSGKESEDLLEKAKKMTEEYDAAVRRAREQALAERARLTKSSLAEAEGIVSSARDEARSLLEERTAELAAQIDGARAEMRSEIEDMAGRIARAVKVGPGNV